MRYSLTGVITLVLLWGCSGDHPGKGPPPSERERDSIIGASQLPGAQGVRAALRVSDSATARRAREDSVAQAQ